MRRTAILIGVGILVAGCAGPAIRSQSPEEEGVAVSNVRLVGDLAVPHGLNPVQVEAVGLVTGLAGTGSDPDASPQRAELIDEMQKRGVAEPNQLLAAPSTSLVLVRGVLRAGIQKGDRFDVEVRVPSRSETTSLRDGWLMEVRLRELMPVSNRILESNVYALSEGAILVDPEQEGEANSVSQCRGRVLGGGIALKSRPLRLLLKPDARSTKEVGIRNSAAIGAALNRRFDMFVGGVKTGVATPKTDEYVELAVHPRYKDNISRYVRVVQAVAIKENTVERLNRIKLLERQLFDPVTCDSAALRLEALGHEGVPILVKGIAAADPLVRFYSAEALAYLDDSRAAEPLAEAARNEPAFRVFALAALSAMDDFMAYDALRELLELSSAETRYGAFRALWAMNSEDGLVSGEQLGSQFSYHLLDVGGPAMIHVTRSYRPEIVLFGPDQRLAAPLLLEPNKHLLVKAGNDGQVTVSRFAVDEPRQERIVSSRVDDVIRAIVELGGTYPDVVQMLQQARSKQGLEGRLEVDAVPQPGREYVAQGNPDEIPADSTLTRSATISNPLPELFNNRVGRKHASGPEDSAAGTDAAAAEPAESTGKSALTARRFLDRIVGKRRS